MAAIELISFSTAGRERLAEDEDGRAGGQIPWMKEAKLNKTL
jgi:hypothetical protein